MSVVNFNIFDLTQYIQNIISTCNQYKTIIEIFYILFFTNKSSESGVLT